MKNIEVKWTGSYPCLCYGEWIIIIDGVDFSDCIPDIKKQAPMDTYGEYEEWHFTEDWDEDWRTYEDGLLFKDWVKENDWVNKITPFEDEQEQIYNAISEKDWRTGSCGGCI